MNLSIRGLAILLPFTGLMALPADASNTAPDFAVKDVVLDARIKNYTPRSLALK